MLLQLSVIDNSTPCRGALPPPFPDADAAFGGGLLRRLLDEQQSLTAVERFTRDLAVYGAPPTAPSKRYSKLLPAAAPGPGQQYAFEVDLDRCSGCKACVTACHALNGLDEQETWRDVGLLVGGTADNPVMQHVTTACHHCLEPACMQACPVDAYEKHPVTGIVKHLDDQCFGCQYCTLACPYDVPKYHAGKGIVRKCDMCSDRLAADEAPACAQACPHEAIVIRIVNVREIVENVEADPFLPAAPEPHLTLPTTTFKSARVFPRNMLPADYHAVSPQHPHWPLIIMLVLTQMSVGAVAVGAWLERMLPADLYAAFQPVHSLLALLFGLTALAASTLHLGRPQYAYRAVLGLRHSWLSREILAFGGFAIAASGYAAVSWAGWSPTLTMLAGRATVLFGLAGVLSSGMIYVFTRRDFWNFPRTMTKFLLTSTILGVAATWLSVLAAAAMQEGGAGTSIGRTAGTRLVEVLIAASLVKLAFEASILWRLFDRRNTSLRRSARLLIGPLSNSTFARFALGLLGGALAPLFLLEAMNSGAANDVVLVIMVAMVFTACLAGELIERYQFFAAVSAPRMPGGLRP